MDNGNKIAEKQDKLREKYNNNTKKNNRTDEKVSEDRKEESMRVEEKPVKKQKKQGSGKTHGGKKGGISKKSVKKGGKKEKRNLVDFLHHKNEMLEKMRKELDRTKQLLEVKEDRLLRMIAEFDNFKKRINREQDLHKKRMYADVLGNLIPVLDDFNRAFEVQKGPGDDFSKGIKLIHNRLNGILSSSGIKEIDADGQTFNPEFHEAMGEVEGDGVEVGKVAHVVLKGYMLDDVVIRPARVMVAGAKKKKEK